MKRSLAILSLLSITCQQAFSMLPAGYTDCMGTEKKVEFVYDFVNSYADNIDVKELLANLDTKASREQRWYASLTLAILCKKDPTHLTQHFSQWADTVKTYSADNAFFECTADDESHFVVMGALGTDGSHGYVIQPANKISRACKHVLTKTKNGQEVRINETWVIMAGSGEFALRNKVIPGKTELGWNTYSLRPGAQIHIPFGVTFQFRAYDKGFVAHCLTTPAWCDGAADNTVDGYWAK